MGVVVEVEVVEGVMDEEDMEIDVIHIPLQLLLVITSELRLRFTHLMSGLVLTSIKGNIFKTSK